MGGATRRDHGLVGHPGVVSFLARYVLDHLVPYRDDVEYFPDVVNRVVEEILFHEKVTEDIPRVRARYVTKLCALVTDTMFLKQAHKPTAAPLQSHLLVAAIYLNSKTLVENLLEEYECLSDVWSPIWGCPLHAAVHIGDPDLLQRLSQRGAKWSTDGRRLGGGWLLDEAVRAPNATEMMTVIARVKAEGSQCLMGRHIPWREFSNALCLSNELENFDVTLTLLEAERSGIRSQEDWDSAYRAISTASKKGRMDVARRIIASERILDSGHRGGWEEKRRRKLSKRAAAEGNEPLFQIFLERAIALGESSLGMKCLIKAVGGGQVGIVRMLLNSGIVPGRLLRGRQSLMVVSQTASLSHSAEPLRYLIECGIIDITCLKENQLDVGFSLVHCIVGAAQRGNIGFLKLVSSQGISLEDEKYYDASDCPLPIIAAKAFRQTDTVKALLNMGVADADPLKSRYAQQFESGEYPCDPPAFLEIGRAVKRELNGSGHWDKH